MCFFVLLHVWIFSRRLEFSFSPFCAALFFAGFLFSLLCLLLLQAASDIITICSQLHNRLLTRTVYITHVGNPVLFCRPPVPEISRLAADRLRSPLHAYLTQLFFNTLCTASCISSCINALATSNHPQRRIATSTPDHHKKRGNAVRSSTPFLSFCSPCYIVLLHHHHQQPTHPLSDLSQHLAAAGDQG